MESRILYLKEISKDIFKLVYCSMGDLPNLYDFIYGLPDDLGLYLDNPKQYKEVKKKLETIYNYFLEKTVSSYIADLRITRLEAQKIRRGLDFKKLRNLISLKNVWEESEDEGTDIIKSLIRDMSEVQRELLERLLAEHKTETEEGRVRENEIKKDTKARTIKKSKTERFKTKSKKREEGLIKIIETSDNEEVKAVILDNKLKKAREDLLKSKQIIDKEIEVAKSPILASEDKASDEEGVMLIDIPSKTGSPEDEKIDVIVVCPKCQTKNNVSIPTNLILQKKNLASISIRPGVCCEHSFNIFIDKNGKIRGYQSNDLEIREKPLDVDNKNSEEDIKNIIPDKDDIEQKDKTKDVLVEPIEDLHLEEDIKNIIPDKDDIEQKDKTKDVLVEPIEDLHLEEDIKNIILDKDDIEQKDKTKDVLVEPIEGLNSEEEPLEEKKVKEQLNIDESVQKEVIILKSNEQLVARPIEPQPETTKLPNLKKINIKDLMLKKKISK